MNYCSLMDIWYVWIYWQVKICRHFSLLIWTSFNGQFVHPVRGIEDVKKGGGWRVSYLPAASITLLEYIEIWCNIQVIIYRFVQCIFRLAGGTNYKTTIIDIYRIIYSADIEIKNWKSLKPVLVAPMGRRRDNQVTNIT